MNISIVGGGPAGLLAAVKLAEAGFKVTVYEEHDRIGFPEHCTGIVRHNFFSVVGYKELESLVLANYSGGVIKGDYLKEDIFIDTNKIKAIMIDRPAYESALADCAVNAGAKLMLKKKAVIFRENKGCSLFVEDQRIESDLIIGARGAKANPNLRVIPGLQAHVALLTRADPSLLYLVFSKNIQGFFGWTAPYDDGRHAKIGLASNSRNLKKDLSSIGHSLSLNYQLQSYFGGLVVVGGVAKANLSGSYIPLGDEAGQTKPITGGGLDTSAFCVLKLVEDIRRGDLTFRNYMNWWRQLKRSMSIAEFIGKNLFDTPPSIKAWAFKKFLTKSFVPSVLRESDFDDHTDVIKRLVVAYLTTFFSS
jgi:digeranylgeranylglycerophospholipid reductase